MHVSEGANPSCQMTATKGDWWRGRGGGVGSGLGSWRWVVLKPWFAVSSAFHGGIVSALFGWSDRAEADQVTVVRFWRIAWGAGARVQ